MDELRERVKKLESTIEYIRAAGSTRAEDVIVLRTISREDAKAEILALFQSNDVLDYGAIAEKLRLDLPEVVAICNELEKEGVIG